MSKSKSSVEVGRRIRERREYLGYTREQFAEIIGISVQFLADNETGRKGMSYETLQKVCGALCLSADYLLFGKQAQNDTEGLYELLRDMDSKYFPLVECAVKSLVQTISAVKSKEI